MANLSINSILSKSLRKLPEDFDYSKGYVYFLIHQNKVVYIGASRVKGRPDKHRNKTFDSVMYYTKCKDCFATESNLIRQYSTKYNDCTIARSAHGDKYQKYLAENEDRINKRFEKLLLDNPEKAEALSYIIPLVNARFLYDLFENGKAKGTISFSIID